MWEDHDQLADLLTISPAEVRKDLFDPTQVQHFHVKGNLYDIDPTDVPTLAAAHFSPNCRSTGVLGARKHIRNSEDEMMATQKGATEASVEWDRDVAHFQHIVKDQRRRTPSFGFTFEQPTTRRVAEHRHMKMMMSPVDNGGYGCVRISFHMCAFGAPHQKATDIYVSQLPELNKSLLDEKGLKKLAKCLEPPMLGERREPRAWSHCKCRGASACHFHESVQKNTKTSVRFPPGLAWHLAKGIWMSV